MWIEWGGSFPAAVLVAKFGLDCFLVVGLNFLCCNAFVESNAELIFLRQDPCGCWQGDSGSSGGGELRSIFAG